MAWLLLILGVALWVGAHLFKRVAPERRAELGDKGRGLVAMTIFASIILMVIGYRWVQDPQVWFPPYFLIHINNLLILIAIFMMSPAPKKGRLISGMRHPMLTGFGLWAFAHLLVNGNLAAIVLFGGLLAWSFAEQVIINRAEPDWTAPAPGQIKYDAMFAVGSVILLAVIGYIHFWLGVWPFG